MSYQLQEIDAADLNPGEEPELRQERERLANAENLASLAQQTLGLLDEGTPEAPSISDLIGQVVQAMASLARIDRQPGKPVRTGDRPWPTCSAI